MGMIPIENIREQYGLELAILVMCTRIQVGTQMPEDLHEILRKESCSWDRLYELAKLHQIRPLVYNILNKITCIQEKQLANFRNFCIQHSIKIIQTQQKTEEIISFLQEHGFKVRLFKGADLSSFLYGDLSFRESSDVDLLIEEADVQTLYTVMKSMGFHFKGESIFNADPAYYLSHHKDLLFCIKSKSATIMVELHYRPIESYIPVNISYAHIFTDPSYFHRPITEQEYLTIMTINDGLHDLYPTLKKIVDIGSIYQKLFCQEQICYEKLENYYCLNKYLIDELLGIKVKSNDSTTLTTNKINQIGLAVIERLFERSNGSRIKTITILSAVFQLYPGYKNKIKLILATMRYIFGPNYNDSDDNSVRFKWIFLLLRPFRLLRYYKRHI